MITIREISTIKQKKERKLKPIKEINKKEENVYYKAKS